ncbi:hypothetical protein, partial [Blautia sp. AF13-16]
VRMTAMVMVTATIVKLAMRMLVCMFVRMTAMVMVTATIAKLAMRMLVCMFMRMTVMAVFTATAAMLIMRLLMNILTFRLPQFTGRGFLFLLHIQSLQIYFSIYVTIVY